MGAGGIDYTEFLAATMDRSLYLKELYCQAAFRMFDCNHDGKISTEELDTVLKIKRGDHNAAKQLTAATLMRQVDLNGDNCRLRRIHANDAKVMQVHSIEVPDVSSEAPLVTITAVAAFYCMHE